MVKLVQLFTEVYREKGRWGNMLLMELMIRWVAVNRWFGGFACLPPALSSFVDIFMLCFPVPIFIEEKKLARVVEGITNVPSCIQEDTQDQDFDSKTKSRIADCGTHDYCGGSNGFTSIPLKLCI